jgi:SsrA-binding protein
MIRREGITLVPLALYFNERGLVKIQIGIAKGKKKADKRQAERDRDWSRQKNRLLKGS